MRAGIAALVAGYILSQFYRAFLAVLAPVLEPAIGTGPGDLAISSALWFLSFAVMQIPVGWALDRIGPRRTASVLLGLGGAGGASLFAVATGPWAVHAAMILIGIGCSPVLMASYFIFARVYSTSVFGTLAGAVIGIGSLGNIAGAEPLAWLVAALGWRQSLAGLALVTLVTAVLIWRLVRDPERLGHVGASGGSLLDLLRIPGLWAIMPLMFVSYAPSAAIRGLWAGPYLSDVFGADAAGIGRVTLFMGLAMVVGNFAYGPLDRVFRTRKWVVFVGNALAALCLAGLWLMPDGGLWTATFLLMGLGLFGASFPAIMAHARGSFPPHLVGRGVTFLNMFGIGGAGILQFTSAPVFRRVEATTAEGPYSVLFLFFLAPLLIGLALYLLSSDSRG